MKTRFSESVARLAVVGVLATVTLAAGASFPLRSGQAPGFALLAIAAAVVGVVILTLMPSSVRTLLRHPRLLVPLGVFQLVGSLVSLLSLVPLLSVPFLPMGRIPIADISLSLSVVLLLGLAAHAAYAAWATCLILQTVRRDRCEPGEAVAEVPRWFWRVAGLEALCLGSLLMIGGVMLGAANKSMASLPLFLLLVAVFTLLLNLGTAGLLPVALDPRLTYWEAVRSGVSRSWRSKSRWWKPMFAQLLLLGLVTYLAVSAEASDRPGAHRHESNRELKVNGLWIGGYESDCRWYSALSRVLHTPKVPLVTVALDLVFGVLAVAVKLSVVRSLEPEPQDPPRTKT